VKRCLEEEEKLAEHRKVKRDKRTEGLNNKFEIAGTKINNNIELKADNIDA
jgi:hypothetical protein